MDAKTKTAGAEQSKSNFGVKLRKATSELLLEKPYLVGAMGAFAAQAIALSIGGQASYHPERYMAINAAAAVFATGSNIARYCVSFSRRGEKLFTKAAWGYTVDAVASMVPLAATFLGAHPDTKDLWLWAPSLSAVLLSSWYAGKQSEKGIESNLNYIIKAENFAMTLDEKKRAKEMVLKDFMRRTKLLDARSDFHALFDEEQKMIRRLGEIRVKKDAEGSDVI
jgi:hypothetical protein